MLAAMAACARPTLVERGQATFKSFGCVKCHTIGYEGGTYGPDLTTIGFRKTKQWLDLWLKNPHGWRETTVMPNFNLNDDIRASLVAFLSEQKGQAWGKTPPWDAPELRGEPIQKGEVMFNKLGCIACHGLQGQGGYPNNNVVGGLIPPINRVFETFTKEELKTRIANGRKSDPADPNLPPPMIYMPAWKELLTDSEIDALVEYLFSLGPKAAGNDSW